MELARSTKLGIDISAEIEVLSYLYSGARPIEVITRVDLGDVTAPISGNGEYRLSFYIDDVYIAPDSVINVDATKDKAIFVSRAVALDSGDTISVRVTGTLADTAVNTVASLRDATPVLLTEIQGAGSVVVDHDYGGTDNLQVTTPQGSGILDASILAYTSSDYSAGIRTATAIRGQTVTDINGRWASPMALDPGDYILLVSKPGQFQARAISITVS